MDKGMEIVGATKQDMSKWTKEQILGAITYCELHGDLPYTLQMLKDMLRRKEGRELQRK